MTKSKFCIASSVFFSPRMERLSDKARLVYCAACAECTLIGEIPRPRSVICTVEDGLEAFEELIEAGFIVVSEGDFEPRYFVADHFVNNSLKNRRQREAALHMYDTVKDLELDFEEDENGLPSFRGSWRRR